MAALIGQALERLATIRIGEANRPPSSSRPPLPVDGGDFEPLSGNSEFLRRAIVVAVDAIDAAVDDNQNAECLRALDEAGLFSKCLAYKPSRASLHRGV